MRHLAYFWMASVADRFQDHTVPVGVSIFKFLDSMVYIGTEPFGVSVVGRCIEARKVAVLVGSDDKETNIAVGPLCLTQGLKIVERE